MAQIGNLRILVLLALVLSSACDARGDARGTEAPATGAGPAVAWFHDLYQAHLVSAQSGRPMLIAFGADWCHYCKEMEATTFRDPKMAAYITANFVPVHLDADRDRRVAEILKVKPIPCTVVLSPNADLLGKIVGAKDVRQYYGELEKSRQQYARLQRRQR